MIVALDEAAAADVEEAVAWYEHREPGLGERFLAALDAVLDHIGEHPLRYRVAEGKLRRAMMPRFPYAVFYQVEPQRVMVRAVTHGRRNPRVWRERQG
ncbi:MAG: type II toxin-antitoxin system RelE/ParE family toxin [Planctomycetota bacterium]